MVGKVKKVRRIYQTGSFREVRDVYVGDGYKPRGPRHKGTARKSQMDANLRAAIRETTRILNGNFSYEQGDLLCTFSFDESSLPVNTEQAWSIFSRKALRPLRKICKEVGRELRFYAGPADKDGETGEAKRIHIHAVLSGVTMEEVRRVWSLGAVDTRTIRREKTHARLAAYLVKQFACGPNEKKWHTSRNLNRTLLLSETEISGNPKYRMPKGAELIAQGEYCPEEGKLLDLQIRMPERPEPAKHERRKPHEVQKHAAP